MIGVGASFWRLSKTVRVVLRTGGSWIAARSDLEDIQLRVRVSGLMGSGGGVWTPSARFAAIYTSWKARGIRG
jgi:hypothetical protein